MNRETHKKITHEIVYGFSKYGVKTLVFVAFFYVGAKILFSAMLITHHAVVFSNMDTKTLLITIFAYNMGLFFLVYSKYYSMNLKEKELPFLKAYAVSALSLLIIGEILGRFIWTVLHVSLGV